MDNLARSETPCALQRVDNVIGLFPGVVPGLTEKNERSSLTVSAARIARRIFVLIAFSICSPS